jgi:hypothetical protein
MNELLKLVRILLKEFVQSYNLLHGNLVCVSLLDLYTLLAEGADQLIGQSLLAVLT